MCYSIDKKSVLIPDLLEIQEPDIDFDYTSSLKFIIEYDFLPKSIIPTFLVKMHKDIKDELRWRTGVVLEEKALRSTAVIKADIRDKKIFIYVNGENKRDYFTIIRKTFRDINGSFEKPIANEKVPLPDNSNITIEYKELLGHIIAKKNELFVGKTGETYDVNKILEGIEDLGESLKEVKTLIKEKEMNFHLHQTIQQINTQNQNNQQTTEIKVDIKIELQNIQNDFDEIKKFIEKELPKEKKELETISEKLDAVTPNNDEDKKNSAFTKAARYLKNLADDNSELNTSIKGVNRGIEYIKKAIKLYNKIAPIIDWLRIL